MEAELFVDGMHMVYAAIFLVCRARPPQTVTDK